MFITKEAMDKLKGEIQIESREGIGSSFLFSFPILPQHAD